MGKRARVILDVIVDEAVSDEDAQAIMEKTFANVREPYAANRFKVTNVTYEEFVEKESSLTNNSPQTKTVTVADSKSFPTFLKSLADNVADDEARWKPEYVSGTVMTLHYRLLPRYDQATFDGHVATAATAASATIT